MKNFANVHIPRRTIRITGQESRQEYSAFTDTYYYDDCKYSWVEVWINPENCTTSDVPGGFSGFIDDTPAVEINGIKTLSPGLITEAWLSPEGNHWLFNGATGIGGGGFGATPGCFKWRDTGDNIDCVIAFSQSVPCCVPPLPDGLTLGQFARPLWYVIFDPNGTITFYDNTQRVEALAHGARLDLPFTGSVCGEDCPEN